MPSPAIQPRHIRADLDGPSPQPTGTSSSSLERRVNVTPPPRLLTPVLYTLRYGCCVAMSRPDGPGRSAGRTASAVPVVEEDDMSLQVGTRLRGQNSTCEVIVVKGSDTPAVLMCAGAEMRPTAPDPTAPQVSDGPPYPPRQAVHRRRQRHRGAVHQGRNRPFDLRQQPTHAEGGQSAAGVRLNGPHPR